MMIERGKRLFHDIVQAPNKSTLHETFPELPTPIRHRRLLHARLELAPHRTSICRESSQLKGHTQKTSGHSRSSVLHLERLVHAAARLGRGATRRSEAVHFPDVVRGTLLGQQLQPRHGRLALWPRGRTSRSRG